MPKISLYLAASVWIVSIIIGGGIGYATAPAYRQTMFDKTAMGLGPADRWLDLRYINQMIAHHRGAMLLAEQAKIHSNRADVVTLANAILADEPKAIDELYAWKRQWYGDTRPVTDPLPVKLAAGDAKFDLRFLNALIAHHETGFLMTQEARLKSNRPEILDNADAVDAFLTKTMSTFKTWRSQWYGV